MTKSSLLLLLENAKRKDQKSQTQLINLFWVDVFSFVMKKVKNEVLADEITVNVFEKVLKKLDLYQPDFKFKTWILTIAQNSVIDFWRKQNSEHFCFETIEDLKNDFAFSPEEIMISEEEQKNIIKVIESLDEHYQNIIRLRFFEEKSIAEIAEELKLSKSNIKVRIMRAKKILAELLNKNKL